MTLWSSVITVVVFSFVVIAMDEFWHWRRRQKKKAQGGSSKPQ